MDFEYRYTEEQQRLRDEAAGWLDAALAALDGEPVPGSGAARALRRKLGEAGWLLPTLSRKYGGAGLSPDLETALFDELYARGLAHVLDRRSNALYDTLDRWGTPEQRRRWLPDVAAGASIAVPALAANPDLDPDEVTVEAALRDGEWALDGVQRFQSAEPSPDYAWLLARNAGRGLVMLLAPLPWPGVSARAAPSDSAECLVTIDFDGVRLPASYAIGEPGEGWEMALSAMFAFDPARSPQGSDALLAKLLDWARGAETGPGAVDDEILQEHLIDAHVAGEVERLFRARLWWAEHTGADTRYLAAQHSMQAKRAAAKLAGAAREVFGPRALTEPRLAALQRRTLTNHVFRERALMASALGLPEASAAEPAHEWAERPAEEPITAAISRGGNDGPVA